MGAGQQARLCICVCGLKTASSTMNHSTHPILPCALT